MRFACLLVGERRPPLLTAIAPTFDGTGEMSEVARCLPALGDDRFEIFADIAQLCEHCWQFGSPPRC
jgi:hypothetical protein